MGWVGRGSDGDARSRTGAAAQALALAVGLAASASLAHAQVSDPALGAPTSATIEPPVPVEGEPVDEETRAAERQAGFLGLSGWTILGIGGGLWLALRWRRTHRK